MLLEEPMHRTLVVIGLLAALLLIAVPVQAITYGLTGRRRASERRRAGCAHAVFGWHLVVLLGDADLADGFPHCGPLR